MNKQDIKQQLVSYGYYPVDIDDKINKISDFIDISLYTKNQLKVFFYDKPSQEIPRFYCKGNYKKISALDGEIKLVKKILFDSIEFTFADFLLSQNLCLVGNTIDDNIEILIYMPNYDTITKYTNNMYEEIYGGGRIDYVEMCRKSLSPNKAISEITIREILKMLISDFVIDKMIIEKSSPKWKLYSDAEKFAEAITGYEYKYINKFKNCIEKIERNVTEKVKGKGTKIGHISNNPYLQLKRCNQTTDFYLNTVTYAWFAYGESQKEELAIYTANNKYDKQTYRELVAEKEDAILRNQADKLSAEFASKIGYEPPTEYIFSCLKRLNKELVIFPSEILKKAKDNNLEGIEYIKYNYKATSDAQEFENMLYSTAEKFKGRCKCRLIEKLDGLYTIIGMKNENDRSYERKADFNQASNGAIIKKEVFVLEEIATKLISNDISEDMADTLAIPILDVIFYFPESSKISNDIVMYNNTDIASIFMQNENDQTSEIKNGSQSNSINSEINQINNAGANTEKRYMYQNAEKASNQEIERVSKRIDNLNNLNHIRVINQQYAATANKNNVEASENTVTQENDGQQSTARILRIKRVSADNNEKIADDEVHDVIAGEKIILSNDDRYVDSTARVWIPLASNEKYKIISEELDENIINLRYTPAYENITVAFQDEAGNELKNKKVVQAQIGTTFKYSENKNIKDKNGNVWHLVEDIDNSIRVREGENILTCIYEVAKAEVIIKYLKSNGKELRPEEHMTKQVGTGVMPTPKPLIYDKENMGWKLDRVHPAILKVSNETNNVITIVYKEALGTVTWRYLDIHGKALKDEEVKYVQVGTKYTPIVNERVIYKSTEIWKLMEIKPYEIVVSNNRKENIIELIYSNAQQE